MSAFQSHTVQANNINISYLAAGKGDLPVIFIHGFPFDKTMWQPQLEVLSVKHRVIAYDIRGFGRSENDTDELSINLFTEDLIRFMDALNINKAILCGLSMGGYIALDTIYRYPERFEALILADTQCIADTPEAVEKRHKTIQQIKADGLEGFTEGFVKSAFHKNTFELNNSAIQKIKKIMLSTLPTTITNGLMALANRWETCTSLNSIKVPTLIICGKQDTITPVKQSEFMHVNIKNSTLKIIDNAAHLSNLEQPDQFNLHLQEFLNTVSK